MLKKYRNNDYNSWVTCGHEILEALRIYSGFAKSRSKKKIFEYEAENERCEISQEEQFKANFFFPLIYHAIYCLTARFEQMQEVS